MNFLSVSKKLLIVCKLAQVLQLKVAVTTVMCITWYSVLKTWKMPPPIQSYSPPFQVAAHATTALLLALLRVSEMRQPACSVSFWDTDRPPATRQCRTSLKWFYTTDTTDMDDCRRRWCKSYPSCLRHATLHPCWMCQSTQVTLQYARCQAEPLRAAGSSLVPLFCCRRWRHFDVICSWTDVADVDELHMTTHLTLASNA